MYFLWVQIIVIGCFCWFGESVFMPPNETWMPVEAGEYPYIVFIQTFKMEHIALGNIVTRDKVVSICSAVTKFYEEHPKSKVGKDIRILAGSLTMYPNTYWPQVRLVDREKYRPTCDQNVAVFWTRLPFVFNLWVQAMPTAYLLNGPDYDSSYEKRIRVKNLKIHEEFVAMKENDTFCQCVGFGATANSSIPFPKVDYSEKLKRVEVTVMPHLSCITYYRQLFTNETKPKYRYPDITDFRGQTCVTNLHSFCAPDIGGPIICHEKVYAMMARTRDCGKYNDFPFVYDMHYFIFDWGYVYGVEYMDKKPKYGPDPKEKAWTDPSAKKAPSIPMAELLPKY